MCRFDVISRLVKPHRRQDHPPQIEPPPLSTLLCNALMRLL